MVAQNCPAASQNLLAQKCTKLSFTLLKIGGLSKLLNGSSSQTSKNTVHEHVIDSFCLHRDK